MPIDNVNIFIFLDKFFFVFHTVLVLFVLFGWLWKRTRLIHLISVALVAGSWFFLGIWYGFGYCPFTEWHWQVRLKLGFTDMSSSYVQFLITTLSGIQINELFLDVLLVACLFGSAAASVILLIRDIRLRSKIQRS